MVRLPSVPPKFWLLALTIVGLATTVGVIIWRFRPAQPTSVDRVFQSNGKVFFGTASDQERLIVPQDAAITTSDFGAVTPENSMKASAWEVIEPVRNAFDFTASDYLVNWAGEHGKKIRGHTFVWDESLPSWVSSIMDPPTLTAVLQNHIRQIMTRYKGKLYSMDVVNEHIADDGSIKSTHWTRVLGNNVFTLAFQTAREVDPTVKLYINENSLETNGAKVRGIIQLVKSINKNGELVDGIGSQTHLWATQLVQPALAALSSAGVDLAITELDIVYAAASDYLTVVNACIAVPRCVSITVWGVRDPDSWRASKDPLLFDKNWQPKYAL
ncbi:glycoside hydrolase superfamily [Roridomyces roridus]|uniref:Beta-xylanase n=1 Tax=Roridomyces roridus TaxID=1738132 RepID=A0AAD7BFU6_9AGAR|nr:glycoside hydrolase superfamily [Roridomyces roridus]